MNTEEEIKNENNETKKNYHVKKVSNSNESDNERNKNSNNQTISGLETNKEAILVYLIPIVGFVFSLIKDKPMCKEAKFHCNQAATSTIISIVISLAYYIPYIGRIISLVSLYDIIMRIIAIVKAQNNELYQIPVEFELTKSIWHTEV